MNETLENVHLFPEAATLLRIRESWLRKHINELPHIKVGRVIQFTDSHIAAIRADREHLPPTLKPVDAMKPVGRRRAS